MPAYVIDPTIAVQHGRVVKRNGDGSIIEFRTVRVRKALQALREAAKELEVTLTETERPRPIRCRVPSQYTSASDAAGFTA